MDENKNQQIRERIKKLGENPDTTVLGIVDSVDDTTCVLIDDDIVYNDVRLHVVLNGDESESIKPKVGSYALAARIEGGEDYYLIASSEVDQWRLSVEDAVLEQDATGLLVKNGADTLRDALVAMIEAVEVVVVVQGTNPNYTKLTEAKTKIKNILKNAT